jgi:hypothetical protein
VGGVLNPVDLEVLTTRGFLLAEENRLEIGNKFYVEVEYTYALVEINLDENIPSFIETRVLDRFGNSELLEQAVNKTMENSLIDLLPSYKEVLNRTPLQIFFGGKPLFGSSSKTKTVSSAASARG